MSEELQPTENSEGESNEEAVNDIVAEISGEPIEKVKEHETEADTDNVEEDGFDREVRKAANRKAKESESDDADDASESSEPQPQQQYQQPQQQQTEQQLQQQYNELGEAVQQLEYLRQTNQISPQQYENAVFRARSQQNELKATHLNNQANNMAAQQQAAAKYSGYNKEIAEAIPDWGDTAKRKNIQEGMKQWAYTKYGVTAEQVVAWGKRATPTDIRMYYDAYKADQPKPKPPPRRKSKKIRTKEADSQYHKGTEAQTDAISDLLTKIGV